MKCTATGLHWGCSGARNNLSIPECDYCFSIDGHNTGHLFYHSVNFEYNQHNQNSAQRVYFPLTMQYNVAKIALLDNFHQSYTEIYNIKSM